MNDVKYLQVGSPHDAWRSAAGPSRTARHDGGAAPRRGHSRSVGRSTHAPGSIGRVEDLRQSLLSAGAQSVGRVGGGVRTRATPWSRPHGRATGAATGA